MYNWSVVCVIDDKPVTYIVLANTAEEAINKVLDDSPDRMREIQQVKIIREELLK